jgi:hypothetical protein
MKTVNLSQDGNMFCALIGDDLQVGIAGFGATEPDALRALSHEMEMQDPVFAKAHDTLTNCGVCGGSGFVPKPY